MALRTGSLSEDPRQLGTTSGALRREARRLRDEGFGNAAERLALAGAQQKVAEGGAITSAESNAEEQQLRRAIQSGLLRTRAQQLRESANPASVARASTSTPTTSTAPAATTKPTSPAAMVGVPFVDTAETTTFANPTDAEINAPTPTTVYQARDATPLTTRVLDRSKNPAGFAAGDEAMAEAEGADAAFVGDAFKPEGDYTLVGSRKGFPVYRAGKNIDAASKQAAAISDRLMRR